MSKNKNNKNQILIDYREKDLIDNIKSSDIWNEDNFKITNLDIGDIQILHEDTILYIIERKTLNDLWSSIKDGRYKEQKLRLNSLGLENKNIYYLIETNKRQKNSKFMRLPQKVKLGFYINTLFNDNMKILYSDNIEETCLILNTLLKKLNDEKIKINSNNSDNSNNSNTDYSDVIHLQKKKNMTPKNCFIAQLAQIPLMSSKLAKPIVKQFGSMINLCKELENLDEKSRIQMLQKFDGIGFKKSQSILNYLYVN